MANFPIPYSGFWQAPQGTFLTPTGAPAVSEADQQYITKAEFCQTLEAAGLGITPSSPIYISGMLDKYLVNASKFATNYCRNYFGSDCIDEWKDRFTVKPMNPEMVEVHTHNSPIVSVNSMYIQVLNWFIQIQTQPSTGTPVPYIQVESSWGIIKIVPLLSSAGVGASSPIPAEIINHISLAKLWYSYNFGYGTNVTGYPLAVVTPSVYTQYQPTDYTYQLWARRLPTNIYVNNILKTLGTDYTIPDYANAIVNFTASLQSTDVVTADFTTNNSIPFDIKMAVVKYACKLIGQATQNPAGFDSLGITGYNVSFGGKDSGHLETITSMLDPYRRNVFHFF